MEKENRDLPTNQPDNGQDHQVENLPEKEPEKGYNYSIQAFRGPLPHPEDFQKFEKVLPGAADRIMKMAEAEQNHRHSIEQNDQDSAVNIFKRGQNVGAALAGFGLVTAVILLLLGINIMPYVYFCLGLASLIAITAWGKVVQLKLKSKAAMAEAEIVEEENEK